MKRYFVLQDWMDNMWFKGEDPKQSSYYGNDWGPDMKDAKIFTEEQMNQYATPDGECWHELPNMEKIYGILTHQ